MFGERQRQRFQRLTLPYLDRLLGAVRRRGVAGDVAEDLVQETYLRAWKAFASLSDEQHVYTWLYRILLNTLADDRRRAARRQALLPITDLEDSYEALVASADPGPYESLLSRLDQARVHAALAELPDEFAEALVLHDIEGFRYRDIAELTGVAIGTVMSRISRARQLLAALLQRDKQAAPKRPASPVDKDRQER